MDLAMCVVLSKATNERPASLTAPPMCTTAIDVIANKRLRNRLRKRLRKRKTTHPPRCPGAAPETAGGAGG